MAGTSKQVKFAFLEGGWAPAHSDTFNVYFEDYLGNSREEDIIAQHGGLTPKFLGDVNISTNRPHKVPYEDELNAMVISDTARVFPATNVQEHLGQVDFEEVRLVDGLTVPLPIGFQDYGYVTVNFLENRNWDVHKFLNQWMNAWRQNGISGTITNPNDMLKWMAIERVNLKGYIMATSKYAVLPPDTLSAQNANVNSLIEGAVTFRIIAIQKRLKRDN